jgi:hypothetical protein
LTKGTDANKSHVELDKALGFVNQFVTKVKRNDIMQRLEKYNQNNMIPAYVFNNVILNEKAIKATDTVNLSQFFVDNGIDYLLVPNAFGWGEMMVVVFNLKKISNVQQIKPTDKIIDYDLPTNFN